MAILMTARMDPELMTCRDVVSTGRYPYTGHLGVLRPEDKAIVEQSLRETDALDLPTGPSSPSATASGSASCLPGPSASSRSSSSSTSRRVFSTSAISWSC